MDRIYKYNPEASYKPNGGRYLQLITAKDLYIQNVTVAEHNGLPVKELYLTLPEETKIKNNDLPVKELYLTLPEETFSMSFVV